MQMSLETTTDRVPDYEWIKAEAKQQGCTVKDLTVLATQNDPFYQGTPTDRKKADWFADVWKRAGYTDSVHLRRMHYWCVSQKELTHYNGEGYENSKAHWSKLVDCAKKARYLGRVSFDNIVDHRNPDPQIFAQSDAEPSVQAWANAPGGYNIDLGGFDEFRLQPYHLEVWCEKSTMNDVLRPICQKYKANLVTGEGELSITACHELAQRIEQVGKPTRIFYLSDFDPAGKSMPQAVARKLEWMLADRGINQDVRVEPLVLTHEQVRAYDLPRKFIKESELRKDSFEDAHGEGAVELDALEALHEGVLADILRDALDEFYNHDARREMEGARRAIRDDVQEQVEEIRDRYAEEIAALEDMQREINQIDPPDPERYLPDPKQPDDEPEGRFAWLYSSARDYFEQLRAYTRYGDGTL
jgi:hypothetical protein